MTIALKIGNEDSEVRGFIYLDAVTSYSRSLTGKVTSFPVDSGANISDHFIANNQKFTLDGVVSGVDITGLSDKVNINGEKPLNAREQPRTIGIDAGSNGLLKFLPSAVQQFISSPSPKVTVYGQVNTSAPAVEALFETLMTGVYYNAVDKRWRNKMTLTTLYEMSGSNFINAHTDLVITDVTKQETVEGGEALHLSISFEKVRLVTLDKTDMPKNAASSVKKKVASKDNQGKQNGESGSSDTDSKNTNPNAPSGDFKSALNRAQAR